VVLMDLRMPGMDGMEAVRRIRARGDAKANLPIIVVTADTGPELREQCLEAGADDVLFKPVAMDALFDSIGRVLAIRGGDMIL
jgi:two-component system response regulator QseB